MLTHEPRRTRSLLKATYRCPVCKKPLTQAEYDQALGLWRHKQEHIRHPEAERAKLHRKELLLQEQATQREREFARRLKRERAAVERSFQLKIKAEVRRGIDQGIAEQKREYLNRLAELGKTKNKMAQLEKSLRLVVARNQGANEQIEKLKEQIQRGITPQIEGLLEEGKLLEKLQQLFPHDRFQHPGKQGDIIQFVLERGRVLGKIVYECKRVKCFARAHIEQARKARQQRQADFAVLVTNAFPAIRQYYFVGKDVFVISPISLEPVSYTLRESLIRMAILRITNQAKEEAVQKVYVYFSSSEYNGKINDLAGQLLELRKDLQSEIAAHKRTWEKRYFIYRDLFNDVAAIDYRLKELAHPKPNGNSRLLKVKKRFTWEERSRSDRVKMPVNHPTEPAAVDCREKHSSANLYKPGTATIYNLDRGDAPDGQRCNW